MHKKKLAILCCLFLEPLDAMPLDAQLFAIDMQLKGKEKKSRLVVDSSYDFANDNVGYSPNLKDGGFKPAKLTKRYTGGHLKGRFIWSDNWSFEAAVWKREVTSKRDRLELFSGQWALQYRLPWSKGKQHYALRYGQWGNNTNSFEKNSYTRFNDFKFTSITVKQPKDIQNQLNFIISQPLSSNRILSGYVGIGDSRVSFKSLKGQFEKNDCLYDFSVEHYQGSLEQEGTCGNVQSLSISMPNTQSLKNNIGFVPGDDLDYKSTYWQLGSNISHQGRRWITRAGYYFQQYHRDYIDDRVEDLGGSSSRSNHTFSVEGAYLVTPNFAVSVMGEYVSNRLLNAVPFTYNSYTADGFDKDGLFIMAGLKFFFEQ